MKLHEFPEILLTSCSLFCNFYYPNFLWFIPKFLCNDGFSLARKKKIKQYQLNTFLGHFVVPYSTSWNG